MPFATLAEIIRHQAAMQPERIALTFADRDTSYGALDRRASQVANGLIAAGLRPQSRVAILDKNHDSFFEIWFGAAKANAVLVPVNWRLAPPEIAFIVNDAEVEILFVGAEFLDILAAIRDQLAGVRKIVVIDRDYAAWRHRQSTADPDLPTAGADVCVQMYTSGTTGRPKGAQLTNTNLLTELSLLDTMGDWARWKNSDVSLVVMPLFHIAGSGYAMAGFFNGAQNVLLREVVPPQILDTIGQYRVTKACFVPAVILFLMQCPGIRDADLSSLQLIIYGASPIPAALLRSALEVFKCKFAQVYGLTETTAAITCLPPEEHVDPDSERLLSCGRALDGVEIRVVGPASESLPPRQVGEIVCRAALVMKGYWKLPEETAKAFDGDWFHTGDAGYLDEAGFLYIYDRVKDMIITGGENVYPAEVESALYGHPAIADVAVIGVPDERWGEAVKAMIVLKPDIQASEAEILAYARERIAGYKLPKTIDFVAALPRTPSGKILKRELRERYWQGQERQVH
ncbi:MAG: fatty acid--CoA ligase [Alphaproteobacteria bacterium]|nr:fatty acid--CoA ligase [Alphaproteobacteria bacterium]